MSDVVALAAFRELCHNACRMRCAMAVLAVGHHLVLCLVAEGTCKGLMLRLAGIEKVEGLFVTCAAIL